MAPTRIWSALGSGTEQGVNALAIDENGHLYAGGSFSMMDGRPVGFIARWDGERWDDLAAAAGRHEVVLDTAGLPNGAYVIRYGVDDVVESRLVTVRR